MFILFASVHVYIVLIRTLFGEYMDNKTNFILTQNIQTGCLSPFHSVGTWETRKAQKGGDSIMCGQLYKAMLP